MKRIATLLVAIVAACSFRASKHSTMLSASSTEPLPDTTPITVAESMNSQSSSAKFAVSGYELCTSLLRLQISSV
jgi:hypothetical protein